MEAKNRHNQLNRTAIENSENNEENTENKGERERERESRTQKNSISKVTLCTYKCAQ